MQAAHGVTVAVRAPTALSAVQALDHLRQILVMHRDDDSYQQGSADNCQNDLLHYPYSQSKVSLIVRAEARAAGK